MDIHAKISAFGGPMAIAKILGITSQAVSQWKDIPIKRVLDLEKKGVLSRYDMRPDIYGLDPKKGEAA